MDETEYNRLVAKTEARLSASKKLTATNKPLLQRFGRLIQSSKDSHTLSSQSGLEKHPELGDEVREGQRQQMIEDLDLE